MYKYHSISKKKIYFHTMLFMMLMFIIVKPTYFNDAASLQAIYNNMETIEFSKLYIWVVGSLMPEWNIQINFLIINIILIYILSLLTTYKVYFTLVVSVLANPLLHPLIGTITRSFSGILLSLILLYISRSNTDRFIFFILGLIAHPLEFVLDFLRESIVLFKKNFKFMVILVFGLFMIFSYFLPADILAYYQFKIELYDDAEISLFNNKKLAVFIIGLLISIIVFKKDEMLTQLNLISWLSLIVFLGQPFFERFWMFPMLTLTMIILQKFTINQQFALASITYLMVMVIF